MRYSHFQDPVVLADSPGSGNPRPPRDIRTPVRRRFNRITGKAIWTPEVILISCTEGRDLRAQISNFESTGVGPHYVISRNGELVNLVEACWQDFATSKMESERGSQLNGVRHKINNNQLLIIDWYHAVCHQATPSSPCVVCMTPPMAVPRMKSCALGGAIQLVGALCLQYTTSKGLVTIVRCNLARIPRENVWFHTCSALSCWIPGFLTKALLCSICGFGRGSWQGGRLHRLSIPRVDQAYQQFEDEVPHKGLEHPGP